MHIRLRGRKFVHADEVRVGEDNAFFVANIMEESFDGETVFQVTDNFAFRCTEQVICVINVKESAQTDFTIKLDKGQKDAFI